MTVSLSTRGYVCRRGAAKPRGSAATLSVVTTTSRIATLQLRTPPSLPAPPPTIPMAPVVVAQRPATTAVSLRGPAAPPPPAPPPSTLASITVVPTAPTQLIVRPISSPSMAPPPAPTPVTGGSGWVRIIDVLAQDASPVSDKVWQDPGMTILQSATAATPLIQVSVEASYPLILVNGASATLPKLGGFYGGDINVTLPASGGSIEVQVVTGDDENGAIDTTVVAVDAPPEILTLQFTGGYPGTQTELKAGDTFQLTGTTNVLADAIDILDHGAFSASLHVVALSTSFTITGTIADRGTTAQQLAARVRARNAAGAFGATRDTNELGGTVNGVDVVTLNNLYPTVTWGSPIYPVTQSALKNAESAVVPITLTDLTTVLVDSPNGQLSVTNPTVIEAAKTVQRIAGNYNVTTQNLRATANRAANNTTTIDQVVVNIAHVAAQLTVTEPAARLRSGGNDGTAVQNHTITMTSNQQLSGAPSLSEDAGGGTFIGSWAGGPTVFTRTLQVHDDDVKGPYTWQSPSATNLAGIVTSALTGDASYVLGGFVARALTFAAFSQTTPLNVEVTTYTKLQAGIFTATNQPAQRNATQGDTSNVVDTYTVLTLAANPTTLFWNDVTAASSNSSGTAQITAVQETV